LKQLPPKPTDEFKNLSPILVSDDIHFLTSRISASYYSQMIAIELIDETLWARKQFAASFDN